MDTADAKYLEEVLVKAELIEAFLQFRSSSTKLPMTRPCPCDSGVHFADCHRDLFAELLPKLAGVPEAALRGRLSVKAWPSGSSR
jgi:SEC-C motif-containing protein